MRLVERFVRSAEGALDYQYTVHDLNRTGFVGGLFP